MIIPVIFINKAATATNIAELRCQVDIAIRPSGHPSTMLSIMLILAHPGNVELWSLTDDADADVFESAERAVIAPRGSRTDPLQAQHRALATVAGNRRLIGMTRLVQGQIGKALSTSSKPSPNTGV